MRKLLSFSLVLFLLTVLVSCSKETTEKYEKQIQPANYTQDFTDDSGRVVYHLDVTYPTLTDRLPKEAISSYSSFSDEFIQYYIHSAEANINNASKFMDDNNSSSPWITKITYDMYYLDETVISFILNTEFSVLGGDVSPTYEGYSVSLSTGKRLSIPDFAGDEPEAITSEAMQAIVETANKTYSENGFPLDEEQVAILNGLYADNNFCISDENISFIYSYKNISRGSRMGCYICEIPLDSLTFSLSFSETEQ